MKKQLAFILILFLAFSLQFKSSWSLSTGQCREYVDGVCQSEGEYTTSYTEDTNPPETVISSISSSVSEFSIKLITLAFQLFGIVILVILLIVVIEEMVKSSG